MQFLRISMFPLCVTFDITPGLSSGGRLLVGRAMMPGTLHITKGEVVVWGRTHLFHCHFITPVATKIKILVVGAYGGCCPVGHCKYCQKFKKFTQNDSAFLNHGGKVYFVSS